MTRHAFIAIAIALVVSMWGCEAFNSDNTPFEGFNEKDIPTLGLVAGAHEGIYEGTATLADMDRSCPSVTEAEGDGVELGMNEHRRSAGSSRLFLHDCRHDWPHNHRTDRCEGVP